MRVNRSAAQLTKAVRETAVESPPAVLPAEPRYLCPKIARAKTVERLYAAGRIEFTPGGMKKLLAHRTPDSGSICRHNPNEGLCT